MAVAVDDVERFRERYAASGEEAVMAAEHAALGSDHRANGYTTRAQALELGPELDLHPGTILLDLGAGCGWPGLYLAGEFGCAVISLDPVLEGVRVAAERADRDGLGARTWATVASAEAIPLRSRSVDAIVHTDVLC